jgi:hypothetical protein
MIIDDHHNYLLAGPKGLLEIHHQQSHLHLPGEAIRYMARIDQYQYLLSKMSKKV